MITNEMQEVWDLIKDDRITEYEKICMKSTFDNVLVKKENLPKLIEAFRNFEGQSSLPEQADLILEELKIDDTFLAIGWNQTSVNGDNWENFGDYNEETELYEPYNINTMDRHWFLFDDE